VLNLFRGTSENIRVVIAATPIVHEFLLRLAIAFVTAISRRGE